MSRSRRKSPICGNTTARSEKYDKRKNNRRIRRAVKMAIHDDPEPSTLPDDRELSDPWLMKKDGKSRFDPEEYPEHMRK